MSNENHVMGETATYVTCRLVMPRICNWTVYYTVIAYRNIMHVVINIICVFRQVLH